VFLGASWTWVIGMFLPVLLVRDHGLWGWVVFAVPNVVGAAAMGWVMRDADASSRFVRRHAGACYAFSLVTIAYHVFFAMWMTQRLRGFGVDWLGFATLGAFALASLLPARNAIRWAGAILVIGVSALMWWMLHRQGVLRLPPVNPARDTAAGSAALRSLWLLPAFVIGFGLCPYLDLTFHRARQHTSPAGGRVAFAVGFGVVFCSMIVFTLMYARFVAPVARGLEVMELTATLLCIHLIAQSTFTVAAHVRELPGRKAFVDPRGARAAGVLVLVILIGAAALGWIASTPRNVLGHDYGEAVYWCFLGFYGLVFPGYLWIHGFPGRREGIRPTQRTMTILLVMTAIAFPAYWMGFVEGWTAWLIPGLSVLIASRALSGKAESEPSTSNA
jgi:hypothetical protein